MQKDPRESADTPEQDLLERKTVSRREFLKLAGIAGATVGVGTGLGGLVAACGGAPSTEGTTATTTAVSAGPTMGRDVKIGYVSPRTGALASFAAPDKYLVERWTEAIKDGVVLGDGQLHKIVILQQDTQSNSNRAAQVAGDLIQNEKIDMMMVNSSPDTVDPVADQCEGQSMPCVANFDPWQSFYFGRGATPDKPFKWTYLNSFGLEYVFKAQDGMWKQISTNKIVGAMWANDADGNAHSNDKTGLPPMMKAAGYTLIQASPYQPGQEDYGSEISLFKKAGCEIFHGVFSPPDFTTFWKQAYQQGYQPKAVTIGKALLFPQTLESLGPIGYGTEMNCVWHPSWPFTSSFTGETCQQLADDFTARTGMQWSQPLGRYAGFEWAVDALKRAKTLDAEGIIAAVGSTKMTTVMGPMDFTAPVKPGTAHPVVNVYNPPHGGGQWVQGTKFKYDVAWVTDNGSPVPLPAKDKAQPMQYSQ